MTEPTITVKRCTKCGETKPVDGFTRKRSSRDGLESQCKSCIRAYYEAHREEKCDKARAYYEAHREERRAYDEARREEKRAYDRDKNALLGNPTAERWEAITVKHATRSGEPWSESEDAYLAASTERAVDDALALKRTYGSVAHRIAHLRRRGVTLARDAHRC